MNLEEVQLEILKSDLDAFLITRNNAFLKEDVLDEENLVQQLTGFSGSNASLLVFPNQIYLFTDGRYEIQAKQEVDTSKIEIITRPLNYGWLNANLKPDTKIGYNPWCHSIKQIARLSDPITFVEDETFGNLISQKEVVVFDHAIEFAGMETDEKIAWVSKHIGPDSDAFFIAAADSVSWLLNQRSNLLPNTPIYRAMALITKDGQLTVFDKLEDVEKELAKHKKEKINLCIYSTPQKIKSLFAKYKIDFSSMIDPCQMMKAKKNSVEQQGMIKTHIRDGISMVKFLYWLESNWQGKTEYELSEKLYDFRKNNENFFSNSFDTIMAYHANAAITHYRPDSQNSAQLSEDGILLIDSGAQYLDGTTDITRTLALSHVTEEQKEFFTIVLKAHIALASTIFPFNTPGIKLDIIARKELWKYGKDYAHGTGHGVGCFLNVHEGPNSISSRGTEYGFQDGMITSIEPGYYMEGHYGIRIENLYKVARMNEDFLYFEPLTLCPIDKRLINKGLLCAEEIAWLNNYHELVYTTLENALDPKEQAWLKEQCQPL